ncbi:hypothetical protein LTR95_007488 [Oleoguttula sp. CCFEE 5521]
MAGKVTSNVQAGRITAAASSDGAGSKRKNRSASASRSSKYSGSANSVGIEPIINVDVPTKHAKKRPAQSQFELLPTELLQDIFVHSGNLDLPFASKRTLVQLSSRLLYGRITTMILVNEAVANRSSSPYCGTAVTRLLGARFFTFDFFETWVMEYRADHVVLARGADGFDYSFGEVISGMRAGFVYGIPQKLLRSPWTDSQIALLAKLGHYDLLPEPLSEYDPEWYAEMPAYTTVNEGLESAIAGQCVSAVKILVPYINWRAMEFFQIAIIDHGCVEDIVQTLANYVLDHFEMTMDSFMEEWPDYGDGKAPERPYCEINFRNKKLLSWAEAAKTSGDPKGAWLLDFMARSDRKVVELEAQLELRY